VRSDTFDTQVALAGSGTDTNGTIASYAWSRAGGTILSSATTQNPTFTNSKLNASVSLIIAARPDLIGFLSGNVTGVLSANVIPDNGPFNLFMAGKGPVWARFKGNRANAGENDNSHFFGAVGGEMTCGNLILTPRLTATRWMIHKMTLPRTPAALGISTVLRRPTLRLVSTLPSQSRCIMVT
jgi:hypothetical protein